MDIENYKKDFLDKCRRSFGNENLYVHETPNGILVRKNFGIGPDDKELIAEQQMQYNPRNGIYVIISLSNINTVNAGDVKVTMKKGFQTLRETKLDTIGYYTVRDCKDNKIIEGIKLTSGVERRLNRNSKLFKIPQQTILA